MINKIIDAISVKLFDVFGENYKIYSDHDVEQGLGEPCFFIAVLQSYRKQRLGEQYTSTNSFDIHYFPKNQGDYAEMYTIADKLYDVLEYITLPNSDLIRGAKMQHEAVEGVLHFQVYYNLQLKKTPVLQDDMGNIKVVIEK